MSIQFKFVTTKYIISSYKISPKNYKSNTLHMGNYFKFNFINISSDVVPNII